MTALPSIGGSAEHTNCSGEDPVPAQDRPQNWGGDADLVGVAVLVFVMLRVIPGDQITASLGTEAAALTPAQQAALRSYYGLDQPLVIQFLDWLGNVLTGNLGFSQRTGLSVLDMTASALPVTLELAILATLFGLFVGFRWRSFRRRDRTAGATPSVSWSA